MKRTCSSVYRMDTISQIHMKLDELKGGRGWRNLPRFLFVLKARLLGVNYLFT